MMNMQELTDWLPSHPPIWCNADLESGLAHIADKAMAIQVAADADGRALTEAEVREITDLSNQFQTLEARLQGHNDAQAAIQKMTRTGRGRLTTPDGPGQSPGQYSDRATVEPSSLQALQRQPFRGRGPVDLFGAQTEKSPFKNFGEMVDLVVRNVYDPRLIRNAAGMSEGVDSDGGYFVPTQYSYRMLEAAVEQSVLFGRVRVEPMTTREKLIASFSNPDASGGSQFGLTLQWLAESGSYSLQKAKTRDIHLTAHKGGILVPVTEELLQDAQGGFSSQLDGAMSHALSFGVDRAILAGNGAGKPLGILNSPSLIQVAKETGQLADTIVFENIVNMFSRLSPACVPNAIWLVNSSALPQLLTMTMFGSGGIWAPAMTRENGGFTLLGRPVIFTEKCEDVGDVGDILLLDPEKYCLGLRRDLTLSLARDLGFQTDEIYVKLNCRIGGQPEMAGPYTPLNGPTTSWAVALDAR